MDRFVWFVLLVVMSHLVTEFTRVTGFTRGPRQDVVMVNDSSIQPIRVQNLVLYPGQEYGHYGQQNQQYYNGNNPYNSYANNNNNNNNNFFSNLFNPSGSSSSNTNNNNNGQQQEISGNIAGQNEQQGDIRTFNVQPIINSIFEIPISTLRAVNNMVGRLTGSLWQQQQQQQQNQLSPPQQQQSPRYPFLSSYFGGSAGSDNGGSIQKSAGTLKPKTEFEMLNRIRQQSTTAAPNTGTIRNRRKASISGFQNTPSSSSSSSFSSLSLTSSSSTSMKNSNTKSLLKQQSS